MNDENRIENPEKSENENNSKNFYIDFDDDLENNQKLEKILNDDLKYISEFKLSMQQQGLSPKTIKNHIDNIQFFLIDFLLNYENESMQEGIDSISYFLGYWFIRKDMWSTVYSVKQNITTFRKFYKCMLEKGNITKEDYEKLLSIIKEDKDEWIREVDHYNTW